VASGLRASPPRMTVSPADALHEPRRLAAVEATKLLDTPAEAPFDRLTQLAAKLTGAPVTFLSLVGEDRDFYKSCFGFPEPLASKRQMLGTTFCHYAIVSAGPLVIEDALAHPIFRNVPTIQSLGVRAYLGVPLVGSDGYALGSFCAIDFAPRKWSPLDIEVMTELAAATLREIELRGALATADLAQRKLDAERRTLDATMRQLPAGVIIAGLTGEVMFSNEQAARIIGSIPTNVLTEGRNVRAFHPDGLPYKPEESPLSRSILVGEVVVAETIRYEHSDGTLKVISVSSTPVRDDEGNVIAGVLTIDDISERERLLHDLAEERRRLDDFFAALSHELRTPMTSIIGWSRLLRMEELVSPTVIEAAEAIASSATLQAQLVDDLLDVSRIAQGKIELSREPLDVNAVVHEAVQAAQPTAMNNRLSLRSRLSEVPVVDGDRARLRQVIGNLLSNAMKFTPAGGLIEVATEKVPDAVCISVRDTGRGIAPELLPFIFERGRQAKSAELGGLGLGLTIVSYLVEKHGGTIRAESDGPGKGATFTLVLPAAPSAAQSR
jgi:PAS domain S-box-containing protein